MMDCDICRRSHDAKRLPFLCTADARGAIYNGRIENLMALIENEGLQKQINDILNETTTPTKDRKDSLQAQQRTAEDRTTQILAAADKLRNDIKAAREEIQARKAALSRRKSDIAAVSDGLIERRVKRQKSIERETGMHKYRWTKCADELARTRSFLCMAAAKLYGLTRVRESPSSKYEYHLGGIPVVDLTAMNCELYRMVFKYFTDIHSINTRDDIHIAQSYLSTPDTRFTLSFYSPSSCHHSSPSRLPPANNFQFVCLLQTWRPRFPNPVLQHSRHRVSACLTTKAIIHRQTTLSTSQGRSSYFFIFYRRCDSACLQRRLGLQHTGCFDRRQGPFRGHL